MDDEEFEAMRRLVGSPSSGPRDRATASHLVERLRAIIAEHGDLPVATPVSFDGNYWPIVRDEIRVGNTRKGRESDGLHILLG